MKKSQLGYAYIINSIDDLALVLQKRRKMVGITQKQLADFCNLSHNGISQIEQAHKNVRFSTLMKMIRITGLKVVLYEDENIDKIVKHNLEVEQRSLLKTQGLKKSKKLNQYYIDTYGITLDEYTKMLKNQNGICALADGTCSRDNCALAIDHDHKTGKVRGLLCIKHNTSLGKIEKKITSFTNMLSYLNKSSNSPKG